MKTKKCFILPQHADLPWSSAVRAGGFIFIPGTGGAFDAQRNPVEGLEAQTRQCIGGLKKELELAGASLDDVVKLVVYLKNVADWDRMNVVYKEFFPVDRPARTAIVPVLLRPDMLVEMDCIAYKPG